MSFGRSGLRAIGGLAALVLVAFGASAWAQPSTYCVKATKVSKIISGKTKHVFTGGFNDKGCASVNATHEGKFEKLAAVIPALVWHPLGLQNGWEVYGGGEWGSPSYTKDAEGFVHLSGAINGLKTPNLVFATLPTGYRPTRGQLIWLRAPATNGSSDPHLVDIAIISSTGEMGSMDSGTGATLAFVSLEGITFYAG